MPTGACCLRTTCPTRFDSKSSAAAIPGTTPTRRACVDRDGRFHEDIAAAVVGCKKAIVAEHASWLSVFVVADETDRVERIFNELPEAVRAFQTT